jgi:hypothetical protein
MTTQEILELAGHRDVPPWVMKLVSDCLERQRNDLSDKIAQMPFGDTASSFAVWIKEQS